ncbi:hypothetical protein F5B17DRAFT_389902 [Nemania serpens]|nr:hypothetical protein F5B17DRAFT_389902 [Nemania serpens]
MALQRTEDDDLAYGERWDHDRLAYETDRLEKRDRDRDRSSSSRMPVRERVREASVASVDERFTERFVERRSARPWEDQRVRERRYPDRRRPSPPPELERAIYHDKEQDRERRGSSPPRRPGFLRRQSSLDTFDRRPAQRLYDHDDHGSPVRRAEYRPKLYEPIPLPRSRALPPPRRYVEDEYEEIKIAEPQRYGDDDFHAFPEHVREREIVISGRESRHRGRSHRSSSHSSSTSSSSSHSSRDTGGTVITAKSEYPKKGKTRIPVRLISIRAIVEFQYPYVIEGNTVIIQKALGQQNIDDLLKLSEEYKKADAELAASRSVTSAIVEERREERFTIPPPAPSTIVRAPPPAAVEITRDTVVRDISPVRSYTSYSTTGHGTHTTARTPVIIDAGPREVSDPVPTGLVLLGDRHADHHHQHHQHHHSHSHSHSRDRELVRAERLPTGELVLYEEEIQRIEEPRRGVRIEKDKKGPPPRLVRAMLATLT